MAGIIPDNNLPLSSQPWGREVQKKLQDLERNFNLQKINSSTVDSQLQSSYKRLDTAVQNINNVYVDVNAITEISNEAVAVSNEALAGLIGLAYTGSTYKVNASNIIDGVIDGGSA
jgi:hypothetical protein